MATLRMDSTVPLVNRTVKKNGSYVSRMVGGDIARSIRAHPFVSFAVMTARQMARAINAISATTAKDKPNGVQSLREPTGS